MFITSGIAHDELWKGIIFAVIVPMRGFETRGWCAVQGRARQGWHLYQDRNLGDFEFRGRGCVVLRFLLLQGAAATRRYPGYNSRPFRFDFGLGLRFFRPRFRRTFAKNDAKRQRLWREWELFLSTLRKEKKSIREEKKNYRP